MASKGRDNFWGKIIQNKLLLAGVAVSVGIITILLIYTIPKRETEKKPTEKTGENQEATGVVLPKFSKLKEYELNYAEKIDPNFVLNLGFFEGDENWKGNGSYDNQTFFEGESSILVMSANRSPGKVYLEKKLNLGNYTSFDIVIYTEEPQNVESLDVKFGNLSLTNHYQFKFSSFTKGWNFARMPRSQFVTSTGEGLQPLDWSQIEKIELTLISRPGTKAKVNLDVFRAEKDTSYLSGWDVTDESFLGVARDENNVGLIARNFGSSVATLEKLADVENFTFQASVSPQRAGRSGLFFRGNPENGYGYYFLIGGLNVNTWQFAKSNSEGLNVVKEGQVGNISFRNDEKYWLKVLAKGDQFKLYLSRDGQSFSKVASIRDSEFSFGQIGVAALDQTFSLFDDLSFKKSATENKEGK